MHLDTRGLPVSTSSAEAAAAFDHLVAGYLTFRVDTPDRLNAMLEADPDFALAHCMQGYFAMLAFKQGVIPVAVQAARTADSLAAGSTARERSHIAALSAWAEGELDRAIALWESILRTLPHDVVAFRLAHFVNFWLGRPQDMVASVERVIPAWSEDIPGYASILACRCFAQEEIGNYLAAEPSGRRAIELDPGDLWAAHAVAHVLEMQGRRSEGIQWLTMLAPNWEGSHNLQHHLWWHCALFKLEHGDHAAVLELYDTRFRNLDAPLTVASPDVYIDVQNAASMLFRLQRLGVDVGNRWEELADKAEARIGDCVSAFTLPHWLMALTATGRTAAAQRMIEAMRAFANGRGTVPPIRARLRAADRRGPARPRCRTPHRGRRPDASGHRRHVPTRRQPHPAGRARAAFCGRCPQGRQHRGYPPRPRARRRSPADSARALRGLARSR
jgi:tetratricopeptide (TPR) repeat protein